jgi:hypothetical protein
MPPAIDPCKDTSLVVRFPRFECTDDVLPNFGNLVDFGRGLGSLPGQLGRIAVCVGESALKQIQSAIESLIKLFDSTFGSILGSVPNPVFSAIKIPEFEMEVRLRALFTEFKTFLHLKVLDILSRIIPGLSFLKIPLPFLPGCTIGDLLSESGRQKIRDTVARNLDAIASALGLPWNISFDGTLGLNNLEMRAQNILSRIWIEFQKGLLSLIERGFRALVKLTEPIRKIWEALGLPSIPGLITLSFENLFNTLWDSVKNLGISLQEKMQRTIDALLNFDLGAFLNKSFGSLFKYIAWPFKTVVGQLLKLNSIEWNLESIEVRFSRVTLAVKDLFEQLPSLILELWMKLVLGFFRAISNLIPVIRELFKYIPFTFCTFIGLVASPILGLGSAVSNLIPAGISVVNN